MDMLQEQLSWWRREKKNNNIFFVLRSWNNFKFVWGSEFVWRVTRPLNKKFQRVRIDKNFLEQTKKKFKAGERKISNNLARMPCQVRGTKN